MLAQVSRDRKQKRPGARDDQKGLGAANGLTFVRAPRLMLGRLMIRMLTVFSLAVVALPLLSAQQTSTPPRNPCAVAQQKQFDFWVGEWELTWPGEKPGETGHGTNSLSSPAWR